MGTSEPSASGSVAAGPAPRVALRQLRRDDRARLLAWRNHPEVARHMYNDHRITPEEHAAWFKGIWNDPSRCYWVVELDGAPVGLANLYDIDQATRSCSWAFYLAEPQVRGRGVGRRVELAVLEHVFDGLRLDNLYCEVLAGNLAVIGLHESMGFEREALLVRHVRKSDGWYDVVRLHYPRARWLAERARLREGASACAGTPS